MGKPTICICENKDADQLRGNREADHAFVFATLIVQFLYFLNPKFPASSHLLGLCSLIYVRPVQKPHCWFSHEAAQMLILLSPEPWLCRTTGVARELEGPVQNSGDDGAR